MNEWASGTGFRDVWNTNEFCGSILSADISLPVDPYWNMLIRNKIGSNDE